MNGREALSHLADDIRLLPRSAAYADCLAGRWSTIRPSSLAWCGSALSREVQERH
jgi:hypothetical protein